ncbi:hypothetical protein D3C72_2537530 [compost metagenome]
MRGAAPNELGNEGVYFAFWADARCGAADGVDGFDAVARILQPITAACQDFLIADCVEVGEPLGKL